MKRLQASLLLLSVASVALTFVGACSEQKGGSSTPTAPDTSSIISSPKDAKPTPPGTPTPAPPVAQNCNPPSANAVTFPTVVSGNQVASIVNTSTCANDFSFGVFLVVDDAHQVTVGQVSGTATPGQTISLTALSLNGGYQPACGVQYQLDVFFGKKLAPGETLSWLTPQSIWYYRPSVAACPPAVTPRLPAPLIPIVCPIFPSNPLCLAPGPAVPTPTPIVNSCPVVPPSLGDALQFAVLGGSAVTNTGSSVVNGDLGLSPGTSVTGFPPGIVLGTQHITDAVALNGQNSSTTVANDLASRPATQDLTGQDLGGKNLIPGVYTFAASAQLTGPLTLTGGSNGVWIFVIGSTLTTASGSSVILTGGVPCNVFWRVGTSATLGAGTSFQGNIIAGSSISLTTGASIQGRALAQAGAVTLDTNNVTAATTCGCR